VVRYVDAAQAARTLGVDRSWVYAHAAQLGAIRLGGPRGRLRFDLQQLRRKLAGDSPSGCSPRRGAPPQRRRHSCAAGLELLPYES
jgi:hypothetical protein